MERKSINDIVREARERALQEQKLASAPAQVKTAGAQDPGLDIGSTDVLRALAKEARELAARAKHAEDIEAQQASMVAGASDAPDQDGSRTGPPPDLSASPSPFSAKTTEGKPGAPSMTPTTSTPEQKLSAVDMAVRAVHERYAREAARLAKQGAEDGVHTDYPPLAGARPEDRKDDIHPTGPTPPETPEAVAAFTAQDADKQHQADMKPDVGAAPIATMNKDKPMAHAESGESLALKAAAMRAYLSAVDPNSKVARQVRERLLTLNKQGGDFQGGGELRRRGSPTPDAAGSTDPGATEAATRPRPREAGDIVLNPDAVVEATTPPPAAGGV